MNVRDLYRNTKPILIEQVKSKVEELNRKELPERVTSGQILDMATEYISQFDPIVQNIEEFAFAAIYENLPSGSEVILRFAGDIISISENPVGGRSIRFSQGVPAFIGWRLLILSGALALDLEEFDTVATIIREPIEIEESNGLFSHKSLVNRKRLFYPEAFLGYANYPIHYLAKYWDSHEYIHKFLNDVKTYHISVARILMVIALATSVVLPENKERHLYPGYRLIPEAKKAMSSLCGKMATKTKYLEGIANVIGDTSKNLNDTWDKRAGSLNEAGLGHEYMFNRIKFPVPMSKQDDDW